MVLQPIRPIDHWLSWRRRVNAICGQQRTESLGHFDTDCPLSTDRVAEIIAMTSAQIGNGLNSDTSRIVGMLHGRFPPCGHFYRMNEFGVHIEQRQIRLAPNRVASG